MSELNWPWRGSLRGVASAARDLLSAGVAGVAVIAAGITGAAAPAQAQASAPEACVNVEVSSQTWSDGPDRGGFLLTILLTNECQTPLSGWKLALTLPPGHSASHGWNADWSQSGQTLVVTSPGWKPALLPGESFQLGLVGTWTGAYQEPLSCTINGVPCDGTAPNQPPQVVMTSPEPGSPVIVPGPVLLAADASDPDGSIDRVEFYLDDELVGTDQTAPYQVEVPLGFDFCTCVAYARAYDDGDPQLSADSEQVSFSVVTIPPLQVISDPEEVWVLSGGTAQLTVRIGAPTSATIEMSVSGHPGVTVSPETFRLDGDTWDTGQVVTVTVAPEAGAGTATVTAGTLGGSDTTTVHVSVPEPAGGGAG